MHCCVHTYARAHVPSRARLVRALTTRPTTRRRVGGAGVSAAAAGTHRILRLGHSTAAGSAASSVPDASLRICARATAEQLGPRYAPPRGAARRPACTHSSSTPAQPQECGGGAGRTASRAACTCRATPGVTSPSWRRCPCRAPRACGRPRPPRSWRARFGKGRKLGSGAERQPHDLHCVGID